MTLWEKKAKLRGLGAVGQFEGFLFTLLKFLELLMHTLRIAPGISFSSGQTTKSPKMT